MIAVLLAFEAFLMQDVKEPKDFLKEAKDNDRDRTTYACSHKSQECCYSSISNSGLST